MSRLGALAVALLLACGFGGCVHQPAGSDPVDCNLDLDFTYDFESPPGEGSTAGNIRMYIFDEATGVLAGEVLVDRDDIARGAIRLKLPPGSYTLVCWASDGEDMIPGGYRAASADGSAVRPGKTTLDKFRLKLDCTEVTEGGETALVPRYERFDDLLYSVSCGVKIDESGHSGATLAFIRDTKALRFRISGLEKSDGETRAGQRFEVFVTAPHEIYTWDNRLAPESRRVRFRPPVAETAEGTLETEIRVQRLELDSYLDRPVLLHLRDADTGAEMFAPLNVVRSILASRDDSGDRPWQTQTDIDTEYEFNLHIAMLVGLGVTVTVEGYDVVDVGGEPRRRGDGSPKE